MSWCSKFLGRQKFKEWWSLLSYMQCFMTADHILFSLLYLLISIFSVGRCQSCRGQKICIQHHSPVGLHTINLRTSTDCKFSLMSGQVHKTCVHKRKFNTWCSDLSLQAVYHNIVRTEFMFLLQLFQFTDTVANASPWMTSIDDDTQFTHVTFTVHGLLQFCYFRSYVHVFHYTFSCSCRRGLCGAIKHL